MNFAYRFLGIDSRKTKGRPPEDEERRRDECLEAEIHNLQETAEQLVREINRVNTGKKHNRGQSKPCQTSG